MSNRRKPRNQTDPRCPGCGAKPEFIRASDGELHLAVAHDADCPALLFSEPERLSRGWIDDGDAYTRERGAL